MHRATELLLGLLVVNALSVVARRQCVNVRYVWYMVISSSITNAQFANSINNFYLIANVNTGSSYQSAILSLLAL